MLSTAGMELSIVVPAFNEARRLDRALPQLLSAVDLEHTEVFVVDDGSTDTTAAVAGAHLSGLPHGHVLRLPANAGKGGATRVGIARARGRAVVFMDADLATDPADLTALLGALESAEVAIGSRAAPGAVVEGATATREIMGRAFNLAARAACGLEHRDTQCGFKAFRGGAGRVLFHLSRLNGFAFDVELLLLARKLGLRVAEVPVHWTAMPGSTVRPVRDPVPMLLDVVRTRLRWRGARPVAALRAASGEGSGPELGTALRAQVRRSDPVVTWSGGALALLPCTDRSSVTHIAGRVRRHLTGCEVDASELAPEALAPAAGGLPGLRAALAA